MHFTLDVKQAVRSGYAPAAYLDAVGDRLVNVHLCDYAVREDGGYVWRMPGQGACDFAALAQALRAHGYAGPAFVEVYSDMYRELDALFESRAYCEAQMGRA